MRGPGTLASVEVGWRLAHEAWGQGYAPEGARRALEFAWEKRIPEVLYRIKAP